MNIEGVTLPAQQEQMGLYRWSKIPLKWVAREILVMVDESININPYFTRDHTRYYGSATRMRVRRAPMQVLEVGNIVASL